MAARTRADKYRTTHYQDRGNAFQQYMVLAELGYDTEEAKYEALMKVWTKELASANKEKERLRKLRDSLLQKQVSANEAADKYIATQQNAVARAEFAASEAFRRTVYSANAAMARAMLFSSGRSPTFSKYLKPELEDLGNKAHEDNKDDVAAALASALKRQQNSVQTPKGDDDRATLTFQVVDKAIAREKQKPEYADMQADERDMVAEATVFGKLDPKAKTDYDKGANLLSTGKAEGYGAYQTDNGIEVVPLGEGALKYFGYKPADYTKVIQNVDKRLAGVAVPKAPTAPIRGDMKEKQRDLYFDAMFPDDDPAYQLNRVMRGLSTMSDEDLLADIDRLVPGARKGNVVAPTTTPVVSPTSQSVAAPITPAPTTPAATPTSPATTSTTPARPKLEDVLLERENRNKEAQRVMDQLPTDYGDEPFIIQNPIAFTPEETTRLLEQRALEARARVRSSSDAVREQEAYIEELAGGVPGMEVEAAAPEAKELERLKALERAAVDESIGVNMAAENSRRKLEVFDYMHRDRTPDKQKTKPVVRGNEEQLDAALEKSIGPATDKSGATISPPTGKKNQDDLSFLEETPADKDVRIRTETALAAQKDYDNGVALKKRETSVGKEVAALWQANKNKGNETLKDQLDYVARTYKKPDEQRLAAEVLYGLEYEQKRATKLG